MPLYQSLRSLLWRVVEEPRVGAVLKQLQEERRLNESSQETDAGNLPFRIRCGVNEVAVGLDLVSAVERFLELLCLCVAYAAGVLALGRT